MRIHRLPQPMQRGRWFQRWQQLQGFPQQPTMFSAVAQECSHPLVPLPPTSSLRIGTTTTPTEAMSKCPHQCNVWKPRTDAQSKRKPRQHHGRIGCRNAQDNLTLGIQPRSSAKSLPPTAAAPAAMPDARHYLAAGNSYCVVWWNAYSQWQLPPAYYHGHASLSAQQAMMSFVGQNPAGARPVPMMQMMQLGQQQIEMPMMMPYYAPYQQIF